MAEAIARSFPHVWWLFSLFLHGFLFISFIAPFFVLFFDRDFLARIIVDGSDGLVTIFPGSWIYIYDTFPFPVVLMAGFFIGLAGYMITIGIWSMIMSKPRIFGPISKLIRWGWGDLTTYYPEQIAFRIWLNKHPHEKAFWDWQYFILYIAAGLFVVLIVTGVLYSIFFVSFTYYLLVYNVAVVSLSTLGFVKGSLVLTSLWLMMFFSFTSTVRHRRFFRLVQDELLAQFRKEEGRSS